jgi:3-oxoacyl-[acyl-carrier protein] reductase
MTDRYQQFTTSRPGRFVSKRLGIPQPTPLRRYEPGQQVLEGPALLGAAPGGRLIEATADVLRKVGATAVLGPEDYVRSAASDAGVTTTAWSPSENGDQRFAALVYDASGIESSEGLRAVYDFFHPVMRRVEASGRVLILATPPEMATSPRQAIAQRALEGLIRSMGKEVGKGATAQLVYVAPGAEGAMESTLRFLLSGKSAYVSGQVIRVGDGKVEEPGDWDKPLADKVALVTGASRGIGAAIARVLARDGAHVICLDVPQQGEQLAEIANEIEGSSLQLDVTGEDAPRALADHLRERHGGVDVVVHNAGITRDKTLGRMDESMWDSVLAVNLSSQEHVNEVLLNDDVLRPGGRLVFVSSVSGIAGNRGQTNYATSKAGAIGEVEALAPVVAKRPATANAVAPGFIETQMTAAMPLATREAGRRMNSLTQGGLPVDVAETIAWLASPASAGVNGNVVRVCGQSLIGA